MYQVHSWIQSLYEEAAVVEALARVLAEFEDPLSENSNIVLSLADCIQQRANRLVAESAIVKEQLLRALSNLERA